MLASRSAPHAVFFDVDGPGAGPLCIGCAAAAEAEGHKVLQARGARCMRS